MRKTILFFLVLTGLVSISANAQEKPSKDYIALYQDVMKLLY